MLPLFMTLFLTFSQPVVTMLENVKRSFLQEQTSKAEALERVVSLEEQLKALEEENASLRLSADEEWSAKERLLGLVHSLTGSLFSSLAEPSVICSDVAFLVLKPLPCIKNRYCGEFQN